MLNWTKIFSQVNKIQIKSITDSLFRYGLYLFVLGTISAIFKASSWVTILLFSVGGLFEFIGLGFYCYFAKKNPDYLRSETFQLKKQSIEMLGDKENQMNPNIKTIIHITSPFSPKELGNESKKEFGE
jgi:hypothetical protein